MRLASVGSRPLDHDHGDLRVCAECYAVAFVPCGRDPGTSCDGCVEIFKPASQCEVHIGDDHFQAVALGSFRLASNRILELHQALLPWEAAMFDESISQEFKSFGFYMHDFG